MVWFIISLYTLYSEESIYSLSYICCFGGRRDILFWICHLSKQKGNKMARNEFNNAMAWVNCGEKFIYDINKTNLESN